MRNLKKVLSLSLALVMLLGMMVVGAGAAEFTDAADISANKLEAAEVMTGIGVFQGSEGALDPKGVLTREQAATIVCNMLLGKSVADNLVASAAPFTDVAASDWSAPYIAYCKNTGIIAGRGDGTFGPKEPLTNLAFATIMLRALGYKDEAEGWTNEATPWGERSTMIYTAALRAGLLANVDMGINDQLDRENAIQMSFNTLTGTMVEYVGGNSIVIPGVITSVNPGTRQNVVNNTTSYMAADDAAISGKTFTGTMQFCEQYFNTLRVTAGTSDAMGRPANSWKLNNKEISRAAATARVTYTAATRDDAISADLNGLGIKLHTDTSGTAESTTTALSAATASKFLPYTLNNVASTVAGAADKKVAQLIAGLTGNGKEVSIYVTGDEITKIVVVTPVLAQITKVNANAKTVTLAQVAPAGGNLTVNENDPCYAALSAMAEKDYVLVTVAGGKVQTVARPDVVTGNITKVTTGGNAALTIGGVDYKFADGMVGAAEVNAQKEVNVYLDSYGYAKMVDAVATAQSEDVIFITSKYTGTNSFGASGVPMIQGILADGTVITAPYSVASEGAPTAPTGSTLVDDASNINEQNAYLYVVSGSTYYLYTKTAAADATGTKVLVDGSIQNNQQKLTLNSLNNFYAGNVRFIFVSGAQDTLKVDVREGVQTANVNANSWAVVSQDAQNNYVVTTVYVFGAPADASSDLVYVEAASKTFKSSSVGPDGKTLYEYEVYVNGVKGSVYSDKNTASAAGINSIGFYTYTVNPNTGVYTFTSVTGGNTQKTQILQNGVVNIGNAWYLSNIKAWNSVGSDWGSADTDHSVYDAAGATIADVRTLAPGAEKVTDLSGLRELAAAGTVEIQMVFSDADKTIVSIYVTGATTIAVCDHTTRTHHDAAAGTDCQTKGNVEYWTCTCGKNWNAATDGTEIADVNTGAYGPHSSDYVYDTGSADSGTATHSRAACTVSGCTQAAVTNENCDTSGEDGACSKCGHK